MNANEFELSVTYSSCRNIKARSETRIPRTFWRWRFHNIDHHRNLVTGVTLNISYVERCLSALIDSKYTLKSRCYRREHIYFDGIRGNASPQRCTSYHLLKRENMFTEFIVGVTEEALWGTYLVHPSHSGFDLGLN